MKNNVLLNLICCLLLVSCEKDKKDLRSGTLHTVNFAISGFSETRVPIDKIKTNSLSTDASVDNIPVQTLIYMLYNPVDNSVINMQRINEGTPGYGHFTDNIPAGSYTVLFIGGATSLYTDNRYFFYYQNVNGINCHWEDSFFKKFSITIGNNGLNQAVEMERITSQLKIVIKDAIPANVKKIIVQFLDYQSLALSTGAIVKPGGGGIIQKLTAADVGKTNYSLLINSGNNEVRDVTIKYYGTDENNSLGQKIISGVLFKKNTITTLSGDLFSSTNDFTITVDQDWGSTKTVNF